jgi:hypothetical protein
MWARIFPIPAARDAWLGAGERLVRLVSGPAAALCSARHANVDRFAQLLRD